MTNKMLSILVIILIAGGSFLAGVMTNYTPDLDVIKKSERAVEDLLSFPKTVEFKDVKYHVIRETSDRGILGYVCGQVLVFDAKNSYSYKRFMVKTYLNEDGRNVVSIPLLDRDEMEFPIEEFNYLWRKNCQNR
ncbi:hypothetical protein EC835_10750 [Providencia alcalifaciens]|uniref:Uncharacterized protein n=1 Tax=Providencia alcalifaciens TaxID=126385 RepID=A0A4R3NHL1_9GAMM|nr:hypothetical protein [Providencia alcalifaciens]TCT31522.1 hypothetical protein EC835_10750 [Providencia alcalifaciens]